MKTLIRKINTKSLLCIVLLTILALCSCNKNEYEPMGIRIPMKWEKTNYLQTEDNGKEYYVVSPEGGTFKFKCTNYNGILLERITNESEMYPIYPNLNMTPEERQNVVKLGSFSSDVCDVTIDNGLVEITFKPNSNEQRKVEVAVYTGDVFGSFYFIQDASQK